MITIKNIKQILIRDFDIDEWTLKELIEWIKIYEYEYEWNGQTFKQIDLQDDEVETLYLKPKELIKYWENTLRLKYENAVGYEDEVYLKDLNKLITNLQKLMLNII